MELLEIRNNLVKLSYDKAEMPTMARFVTLSSPGKSYVGQFVNLKSDLNGNFAIAKLLFTFTNDGIVDSYDGSVPQMDCGISMLQTSELLDLLTIETPLKIGKLSQQSEFLNIDVSVFENNFSVFAPHNYERKTVISNFVRQLFQMREKSVVIDIDNSFGNFPKLQIGQDFKLPLNSNMIDFIFEYELANVDASTKAIIQDIFYAVQQYIDTLQDGFLPIDNFIEVVSAQYKESQMPELALLKNKLLKYRDANIFANTKDEISELKERLGQRNAVIIDLSDFNDEFQKAIITYIHRILDGFDKYVYFFVPLNDENSDKKLLKRLINHSHVFTTIFADHAYKYATDLKEYAQNLMFFAPLTMQHDFASYNTFLSKLNPGEAIIYGKLTHGIPLILDIEDLDLDITEEDVFGEGTKFIPSEDVDEIVENQNIDQQFDDLQKDILEIQEEKNNEGNTETISQAIIEPQKQLMPELNIVEDKPETNTQPEIETSRHSIPELKIVEQKPQKMNIIEPTENVLEQKQEDQSETEEPQITEVQEQNDVNVSYDDEITLDEDLISEDSLLEEPELTEDDLDYMETNQSFEQYADDIADLQEGLEQSEIPMVPVYTPEEDMNNDDDIEFQKGDQVTHPKYGNGIIEKIIKYGNRTLCAINFENVGKRVLDPSVSEFEKI